MAQVLQLKKQYDASNRLQLVSQYAEQTVETVVLLDDFDSAIGGGTVTSGLTSTPSIVLTADNQPDVTGWLMTYAIVSGVNGKTPLFSQAFTSHALGRTPKTPWYYVWRYRDDATAPLGGRPRPWNAFDNNAGTGTHSFSNNTPFTSDVIEVASKPRWKYLDTQRAVAYAAASGFHFELPSSIAASGLPANVHTAIAFSGALQNSAAATTLNMYCVALDDTSVSPDGGSDKLNVVLIPGQHSSEDQGNESAWEWVQFYINGTGTVADLFRKNYRLHLYDANPAGRYYGKERFTEEDTADKDPNRAWDDTGSSQITSVMAAIAADLSRVDIFLDFHGDYRLNDNGVASTFGMFSYGPNNAEWLARASTALSPLTISNLGTSLTGYAQYYGSAVLGAQLSLTIEMPIAAPNYSSMEAMYTPVAEAYIEAINAMVTAGEITLTSPPAPTGTPVISGVVPSSTSAVVSYTITEVSGHTGFKYTLDGTTYFALGASPATITELAPNTTYSLFKIVATNDGVNGTATAAFPFTTDAALPAEGATHIIIQTYYRALLGAN